MVSVPHLNVEAIAPTVIVTICTLLANGLGFSAVKDPLPYWCIFVVGVGSYVIGVFVGGM